MLLIAVSFLSFLLISASPVDPVRAYIGEVGMANIDAENLARLEAHFGVDTPPVEGYLNWFGDFIRGDMGTSSSIASPWRTSSP